MGQKITGDQIEDGAVTSDKANLSYVHNDGTGYTVKTLSATNVSVGMSITLPAAGTWLVLAKVRTRVDTTSVGRYIRLYLYQNNTTPLTESICNYEADRGTHSIHNEPIHTVAVTTSANETIDIWAQMSSMSGVTYGKIESDTNGYTTLTAVRIA